jgi:tRNA-Thr(GGU) m(6)t(6)A37 methyltransferase TsaA
MMKAKAMNSPFRPFSPIGHIETPFQQKLGIPRQSGLVKKAWGRIILDTPYRREDCLRGLDRVERLWLIFDFNQVENWRPTICPPAMKERERVGVFATRSPHRPNPIGLSVVEMDHIDDEWIIHVRGIDLLDQTPIYDIKPYVAEWDAHPDSNLGWRNEQPALSPVSVSFVEEFSEYQELLPLIMEVLQWNPAPRYVKKDQVFKQTLDWHEIVWKWSEDGIQVLEISKTRQKH